MDLVELRRSPGGSPSVDRKARLTMRVRAAQIIAAGALATAMLSAPVAAGATTLTGSGSSAAQPTMLELFKTYRSIHTNVHFKYVPDGGNEGVKDVQDHRSQ